MPLFAVAPPTARSAFLLLVLVTGALGMGQVLLSAQPDLPWRRAAEERHWTYVWTKPVSGIIAIGFAALYRFVAGWL